MAQTSDSPPPQTLHAQSEPTTSAWLRKLPTQLNTRETNIFVPDLVQVSPNTSTAAAIMQLFCVKWATERLTDCSRWSRGKAL